MNKIKFCGVFSIKCIGSTGEIKWEWNNHNLVVNQGLQHILDTVFLAGSQKTSWYLGLMSSSPTVAAANTLASHTGWTEFSSYSGSRKLYSATRSNQTISNNSTKATFIVTNSGTVGGAFLCSTSTNSAGILMCGVVSTEGNQSVIVGDTIEARYDFTDADDGV